MDEDLKRLADAAEALERRAAELREQVERLAAAERGPAQAPDGGTAGAARDEAGARLVAYSMALDGRPREEIAGQLAGEFGLEDSDALLDEVYEQIG